MEAYIYSEPLIIKYDNYLNTLVAIWNTPIDLPNEEYVELVYSFIDAVNYFKPDHVLIHASNSNYAIPSDVQEWINETVFPLYKKYNTQKLAIIMSTDFFAQLSFESITEDLKNLTFDIKYFESEEDALHWIDQGNNQKYFA